MGDTRYLEAFAKLSILSDSARVELRLNKKQLVLSFCQRRNPSPYKLA
ncbi:MAG: hypothetical protein QXI60_06040 [Thermofilaceae archaeon]